MSGVLALLATLFVAVGVAHLLQSPECLTRDEGELDAARVVITGQALIVAGLWTKVAVVAARGGRERARPLATLLLLVPVAVAATALAGEWLAETWSTGDSDAAACF